MIDIIDDCVPKEMQDYFEIITLGNTNNIEVEPSIEFKCKYEPTAFTETSKPLSFKHVLKSSAESSNHLVNFSKVATIVMPSLQNILFARIFLTLPYDTKQTHHAPHVDLDFPHKSLIYYVNDSEGDTVFFEKDYETIIDKVSPKKGRAVLFDGLIPHAAGIPTFNPRCIVNYNLI